MSNAQSRSSNAVKRCSSVRSTLGAFDRACRRRESEGRQDVQVDGLQAGRTVAGTGIGKDFTGQCNELPYNVNACDRIVTGQFQSSEAVKTLQYSTAGEE